MYLFLQRLVQEAPTAGTAPAGWQIAAAICLVSIAVTATALVAVVRAKLFAAALQLAVFGTLEERIIAEIRRNSLYPLLVLLATGAVALAFLTYVVPGIETIFESTDTKPSAMTKCAVLVAQPFSSHPVIFTVGYPILAAFVFGYFAFRGRRAA